MIFSIGLKGLLASKASAVPFLLGPLELGSSTSAGHHISRRKSVYSSVPAQEGLA